MNDSKKTWVWIALTVSILTGVLYWVSSGRPEPYPPYLTESPSPTGVKAYFTLLDEKGENPRRWNNHPAGLPAAEGNQTLLLIEPFFTVSGAEMDQYEQWMEEGNTLWLMKNNPVGYFDVEVEYGVGYKGETTVEDQEGRTYQAVVPQEHRLLPKESDKVLLSDEQGTLAFERPYGEGKLMVGMNPDWFTNGVITDQDHYEIISSILRTEPDFSSLWFDEYVHKEKGFFSGINVYPMWLSVFTIQAALLLLFFLWMQGKRFGPAFLPREASVRFGDERLQALAAWYRKGTFYRESLQVQESYIRKLLHERFGVSSVASWQDIRHTLSYRLNDEDYKAWEGWTRAVEPLVGITEVDKKEFLKWSHTFDEMRKEVQGS